MNLFLNLQLLFTLPIKKNITELLQNYKLLLNYEIAISRR